MIITGEHGNAYFGLTKPDSISTYSYPYTLHPNITLPPVSLKWDKDREMNTHVFVHTYAFTVLYMCVCVFVCMYIYICVYTCLYIHSTFDEIMILAKLTPSCCGIKAGVGSR